MTDLQNRVNQFINNRQWLEAIELLSEHNRLSADTQIEKQLIDLRVQGFHDTTWPAPTTPFPPATASGIPEATIPEITAEQLNAKILGSAVLQHGSLLVRNLIPQTQIEALRNDIEQAVTQRNKKEKNPYYSPSDFLNTHYKLGVGRKFIAETGGVWAADSPRSLFRQ